jgi:hypothetical protein
MQPVSDVADAPQAVIRINSAKRTFSTGSIEHGTVRNELLVEYIKPLVWAHLSRADSTPILSYRPLYIFHVKTRHHDGVRLTTKAIPIRVCLERTCSPA